MVALKELHSTVRCPGEDKWQVLFLMGPDEFKRFLSVPAPNFCPGESYPTIQREKPQVKEKQLQAVLWKLICIICSICVIYKEYELTLKSSSLNECVNISPSRCIQNIFRSVHNNMEDCDHHPNILQDSFLKCRLYAMELGSRSTTQSN